MNFSIGKSDMFGNCFSLGTAWMPVTYIITGGVAVKTMEHPCPGMSEDAPNKNPRCEKRFRFADYSLNTPFVHDDQLVYLSTMPEDIFITFFC